MPFNPFTKPVGELLDANDLDELINRRIAEGLFVEFKSTFVATEKIGRSIASFANSYGGWYIVGVEAEHVEKFTLPIVNRRRVRIPTSKAFYWDTDSQMPLLQILCFLVGNALGLPSELQASSFFRQYGTHDAAEAAGTTS